MERWELLKRMLHKEKRNGGREGCKMSERENSVTDGSHSVPWVLIVSSAAVLWVGS